MKIVTVSSGNSNFIEIQHKTLQRHVKFAYEFFVVNACVSKKDFSNFGDENILHKTKAKCQELDITFLDLFDSSKNEQHEYNETVGASYRHCFVLKRLIDYMKSNPDKYIILDSDMFLIDDLYKNDIDDYHSAVVVQERSKLYYAWPGLLYIDMKRAPRLELLTDLNNGLYDGISTDTGGGSCRWLMAVGGNIPAPADVRVREYDYFNKNGIKYIKHLFSMSWDKTEWPERLPKEILDFCEKDSRNKDGKYFCEIYDRRFFHLRGGSGWMQDGDEMHKRLSCELHALLCTPKC